MGDEGVVRVQHLHHVAVDPVGVDGRVVGGHRLPVLGQAGVAGGLDFGQHVPGGAARAVGLGRGLLNQGPVQLVLCNVDLVAPADLRDQQAEANPALGDALVFGLEFVLNQGTQGKAGVADQGVGHGVHLVDVQLVHVAEDDGLVHRVQDGVAEAVGRQAGPHRQNHVALGQIRLGVVAAHPHKQRVVLGDGSFGLEGGNHRRMDQFGEGGQFSRGPGVDYALPGVDQRVLGL